MLAASPAAALLGSRTEGAFSLAYPGSSLLPSIPAIWPAEGGRSVAKSRTLLGMLTFALSGAACPYAFREVLLGVPKSLWPRRVPEAESSL